MKKETLMRFKRATAAGLVSAILALGTSCGFKPSEPTNSTTQSSQTTQASQTTQTTQTTSVPYVEVDPKVDATVIGKENTLSLINLSNTVRQMINDDSAFGNNFSYRAESVLVTGISVTDYIEEEEEANVEVQQDETPKKSLVTISYTADAVDKTTGEKANINDSISYVTQNQEVNKLSNKAFSLSEVDAFSTALIEANQEKIAEAQKSQPTTPSGDTTIKTDPADAIKSSTTVADATAVSEEEDYTKKFIETFLAPAVKAELESDTMKNILGDKYEIQRIYFAPGIHVSNTKNTISCDGNMDAPLMTHSKKYEVRQGGRFKDSDYTISAYTNYTLSNGYLYLSVRHGEGKIVMKPGATMPPHYDLYDYYDLTNYVSAMCFAKDKTSGEIVVISIDTLFQTTVNESDMQKIADTFNAIANTNHPISTENIYDTNKPLRDNNPFECTQSQFNEFLRSYYEVCLTSSIEQGAIPTKLYHLDELWWDAQTLNPNLIRYMSNQNAYSLSPEYFKGEAELGE